MGLSELHKQFQEVPKIREPQEYLESAIKVAKLEAEQARDKTRKDELVKTKTGNHEYVQAMTHYITHEMLQIIRKFPAMDRLPKFYKELINAMMDRAALKHSLGAIQFCADQMKRFEKDYLLKLKRQQQIRAIIRIRGEFLGRVASVLKNITKELAYAEHCRREIKAFPILRDDCFTVCIFGFPNVGKTTLLYKLTGSKPEIAPYAFTTKTLNIGYLALDNRNVQLIDTPGTLNRFEQMNRVEQQAWVALQHADAIIYVFDPTESTPWSRQEELLGQIKKLQKPKAIFFSKTDLIRVKEREKFKKQEGYSGVIQLIEWLKGVLRQDGKYQLNVG